MECVEGVCPVFGGTIPAAIWHDYMLKAVDHLGIAPTEFPIPSTLSAAYGLPSLSFGLVSPPSFGVESSQLVYRGAFGLR